MDSPFFSIIVPIFKVERYLEQCLKGVLEQTCNDYELILVDDGSPDRCGEICDMYAKEDGRVKVIHKKNGGLSSARNAGLDIAIGEYIVFLDSDDFWDDLNALDEIKKNLTDSVADVLIIPFKRYYEDSNTYTLAMQEKVNRILVCSNNKNESTEYLIKYNLFRASACSKIIRRHIVSEHYMRFIVGCLSEDMDWCGDILLYCNKFDYYNNPFYCYRQQRGGSITANGEEKLVSDKLFMIEKGIKQANKQDDNMKNLLGSYYAYEYAVTLGVSSLVKDNLILKKMKLMSNCLNYDMCYKVSKVKLLKSLFGYELTRKILCLFVKFKK